MTKNKNKSVKRQVRVLAARELMNTKGGVVSGMPHGVLGMFLPPSKTPHGILNGVMLHPPKATPVRHHIVNGLILAPGCGDEQE
jgi:hypothetical protein